MTCAFVAGFSRGFFLINGESVSPNNVIHRPGGSNEFLSRKQRNLKAHMETGNTDLRWDYRESSRTRSKKVERGKRGVGGQNFKRKKENVCSPRPVKVRRVYVSNIVKLRAVNEYDKLCSENDKKVAAKKFLVAFPKIPLQNMFNWRRNKENLEIDGTSPKTKKLTVSSKCAKVRAEAWFPQAENIVFDTFKRARENGLRCGTEWFTATMQGALAELFPGGEADDFNAGDGWRSGFFKRKGLCFRVATNVMPLSIDERVPQCLKFYVTIQRVCAEGGMDPLWKISTYAALQRR